MASAYRPPQAPPAWLGSVPGSRAVMPPPTRSSISATGSAKGSPPILPIGSHGGSSILRSISSETESCLDTNYRCSVPSHGFPGDPGARAWLDLAKSLQHYESKSLTKFKLRFALSGSICLVHRIGFTRPHRRQRPLAAKACQSAARNRPKITVADQFLVKNPSHFRGISFDSAIPRAANSGLTPALIAFSAHHRNKDAPELESRDQ